MPTLHDLGRLNCLLTRAPYHASAIKPYSQGLVSYASSLSSPDLSPMCAPPVWNQELEVLYQSVTPSTAFDQLCEDQEEDDRMLACHYYNC